MDAVIQTVHRIVFVQNSEVAKNIVTWRTLLSMYAESSSSSVVGKIILRLAD